MALRSDDLNAGTPRFCACGTLQVEEREVRAEELGDFDEVCACGTAVVITPVGSIAHPSAGAVYEAAAGSKEPGPVATALYRAMRAIQTGEAPDSFGWTVPV